PDGRVIITGSERGTTQFWLTATGLPIGPPVSILGNVSSVAYSPDGSTALATRTYQPAAASLWQAPRGQAEVFSAIHTPEPKALPSRSDGQILATAGGDGRVRLWKMPGGEPVGDSLEHSGPVPAIAFSPDGALLAAASNSGIVQLWDVATAKPHGQP